MKGVTFPQVTQSYIHATTGSMPQTMMVRTENWLAAWSDGGPPLWSTLSLLYFP